MVLIARPMEEKGPRQVSKEGIPKLSDEYSDGFFSAERRAKRRSIIDGMRGHGIA
jgi:hypothetical protein